MKMKFAENGPKLVLDWVMYWISVLVERTMVLITILSSLARLVSSIWSAGEKRYGTSTVLLGGTVTSSPLTSHP
jgi:hypothetical protein